MFRRTFCTAALAAGLLAVGGSTAARAAQLDRKPDHPRLRAALDDLRDARDELRNAKADAGDLKERALEDIDIASGDIQTLVRNKRR